MDNDAHQAQGQKSIRIRRHGARSANAHVNMTGQERHKKRQRSKATTTDKNSHILRSFKFLDRYSHEHHIPLQHPFLITVPMLPKRYGRLPVRRKSLLQRRQSIMGMPE